jgi:FMN phosphatase YigB (HAD superfamily)
MTNQKYVVCDLDGTLCDHSHRVYLAWLGRWDDYNAGCVVDKPNLAVVDFLWELNGYKIIFLTGRSIKYEQQTTEWLDVYSPTAYDLIMRNEGDFKTAAQFKKYELADWCAKNNVATYQIEYAIDDNEECVQLFRDLNIKKVIHYK